MLRLGYKAEVERGTLFLSAVWTEDGRALASVEFAESPTLHVLMACPSGSDVTLQVVLTRMDDLTPLVRLTEDASQPTTVAHSLAFL